MTKIRLNRLSALAIVLLVFALGAGTWVYFSARMEAPTFEAPSPGVGPKVVASEESEVIARGHALVYGAAHCVSCHGDSSSPAGLHSEIPLSGGKTWDLGPIGRFTATNLTMDPSGIKKLKDAEIARSLRYGISSKGQALFPIMNYSGITDGDLIAIISYLRTTRPVKSAYPEAEWKLAGKVLRTWFIKPLPPLETARARLESASGPALGRYLSLSVADCVGCHTERHPLTGAFSGKLFAGGQLMNALGQDFVTPNLTPAPETGRITHWSEARFVARFREPRPFNGSPMPWLEYMHLSEHELRAIYQYLASLAPVENPASMTR